VARKKKKKINLKILSAVLAVVVVSLLVFANYLKSPAGRAFLLDVGVGGRYGEVQKGLGVEILRALREFDAYSIREKVERGEAGRKIVHVDARVPSETSLVQLNIELKEAARRMGGRIVSAIEMKGGRGLEVHVGTRKYTTHVLRIVRGRRTLAPLKERISRPIVAVLVDDFGYFDNSLVRKFLEFDAPITITIIPGLRFSRRIAEKAEEMGREFLCHMPMEPENGVYDELPLIKVGMSSKEITEFVLRALEDVPGAVGMNNHMGSRATADERVMKRVLSVCRKKGLFFVDSMTSPKSVAFGVAKKLGVPCVRNDLFLDNRNEDTRAAMERLIGIARRRGYAVGIMHVKKNSFEDLVWFKDEVEKEGVEMVNVSRLIGVLSGEKEE